MLDLVSSLGKPVSVRDLVRRLSLDSAGRRELKSVLRRLIADGALVKIRGARVGLPDRMNLVVGRLSCSPAGYGFVVPEARREGQADLYVAAANIREALHGDRVVARVERHGPRRGPRAASSASSSAPTSASWAATRSTGASAATWCPSTAACCTRSSSRPARKAAPSRARWSRRR